MGKFNFCSVPSVEKSTKIIAVSDIIFGILFVVLCSWYLNQLYMLHEPTPTPPNQKIYWREWYWTDDYLYQRKTGMLWLTWGLVVGSVTQTVMGVILWKAAVTRDVGLCRIWQYVTILTCCLSIPFIFRVFSIMIVKKFCETVEEEDAGTGYQVQTNDPSHAVQVEHLHPYGQSVPNVTNRFESCVPSTSRSMHNAASSSSQCTSTPAVTLDPHPLITSHG